MSTAISRRAFLAGWAPLTAARQPRPNIVVIVADDLGYGSLGVQGQTDIPTPRIDSIARNGVRFTSGYVSCPVCSPTRAGLVTGRYQQRFGHEFNPGPPQRAEDEFGLPLSETTLPQRLKAAGYSTGMVGKWHLGYRPEYHPLKRGFDEYFGFLGGAHSYVDARQDAANPILRGVDRVDEAAYLTDAFTREALAFIERQRDRPYFLYLTFNAVHAPMQAIEKYTSRFPSLTDERRRKFAGMITALDEGVGRVLDKVSENTLVVFVSDNGGPTAVNTSSNGPLRGFKGQVLEGGIRVPFMMQWKGRIPPAKVYDQPVIALDIMPTALAAAGADAPRNLDGVDLLPYVTGRRGVPHERLYWRFGIPAAVRARDWKLVRSGESDWQLYNLAEDIHEDRDLASKSPEKVKELLAAWEAWSREMAEPRWNRQRVTRKRVGGGGKRRALR